MHCNSISDAMLPPSPLSCILVLAFIILLAFPRTHEQDRHLKHNLDPTPPGYEDAIWCPRGTCNVEVTNDFGSAGPSRFFHECYSADLSTYVEEAWTGSRSDVEPPYDWVTEPELKKCRQPPVHWSEIVRKEGFFGTFRMAGGGNVIPPNRNSRGRPLTRAGTSLWCWDVKGGMKPNNKIILKRCNEDSTKQLFVFRIAKGSSERGYQKTTLHPKRKKSLCVGVARIREKSWLRLEKCNDNDESQLFGQKLGSNLCGKLDIPNTDLVVTTQGLKPSKGSPVMLRSENDLERFGDAISTWCPLK